MSAARHDLAHISLSGDDARLVRQVSRSEWEREGIPEAAEVKRRELARELAQSALEDYVHDRGFRTSPLGPGWSTDIDVYLRQAVDPRRLESRGWVPLDSLQLRIGRRSKGRWAILHEGCVLTAVDLHESEPRSELEALVSRCRRRQDVRLREILEFRALARMGANLPPSRVLERAAQRERELGGELLQRWLVDGNRLTDRALEAAGNVKRRFYRRRQRHFVVAISGVDGAGKSTLAAQLESDLQRLSVASGRAWARPGMRMRILRSIAVVVKRVLRRDPQPTVRRVARGARAHSERSRTGLQGWVWAMAVALSYVLQTRRLSHHIRGVVIFDRHVLDALVTLDFVYPGRARRLQRSVVRRLTPHSDMSFYLDVPEDVAIKRKESAVFGEYAVRRQLDLYKSYLQTMPSIKVLDGTRTPLDLAEELLRCLADSPTRPPG